MALQDLIHALWSFISHYQYLLKEIVSDAGFACEASVEAKFSYVLLGQTILGAALYWWAGPLSHSMPFRLSAGSLGFMALSVLILIFVLSRSDSYPAPNSSGSS